MPEIWINESDFFFNTSLDLILLSATIILMLIMYFLPKHRRCLINTNSDSIDFILRTGFWVLIGIIIVFNFFLYFAQPTYNESSIGLERRENSKDVKLLHLETGKTYTFGSHIYKFISSHPDDLYYKNIVNWIWDNIFTINNIAIFIITFYVFILFSVFKLNIFYFEKY